MATIVTNTGNDKTDKRLEALVDSISKKDANETRKYLGEMFEEAKTSPYLAKWITMPANITYLHQLLIENFGIDHRSMMIKGRIASRQRRAVMFIKAMQNGMAKI